MDDVPAITQSLHDLLLNGNDKVRIVDVVEALMRTDDARKHKAVCEVFLELIDKGPSEEVSLRRKHLLEDSALTLVPVLLPVASEQPMLIDSLMNRISSYSNPKEVVLALEHALHDMEDRTEGVVVSDDEGEFQEPVIDWEGLALELGIILRTYTSVIPRLPNKRSTPIIMSLSDAIALVLPVIAQHARPTTARATLSSIFELVSEAYSWSTTTSDAEGEQRSILLQMFSGSLALFAPRIDARFTERWFESTFAELRRPAMYPSGESSHSHSQGDQEEADHVFGKAKELIALFERSAEDLLDTIIDPSILLVHTSLASLNILASSLAVHDDLALHIGTLIRPTYLEESVRVLCAALNGSSVDAGVTWLWFLVHWRESEAEGAQKQSIAFDDASTLIELLVPICAQAPSPTMRLAVFKLIGDIISLFKKAHDRILLLEQLLSPSNPFQNVRLQSLALLRQLISQPPSGSTSLLGSSFAETLFPIVFPSFAQTYAAGSEGEGGNPLHLSVNELLATPWPEWWIESLHLLWLLLEIDGKDRTGVRGEYKQIVAGWLEDVGGAYQRARESRGKGLAGCEGQSSHTTKSRSRSTSTSTGTSASASRNRSRSNSNSNSVRIGKNVIMNKNAGKQTNDKVEDEADRGERVHGTGHEHDITTDLGEEFMLARWSDALERARSALLSE